MDPSSSVLGLLAFGSSLSNLPRLKSALDDFGRNSAHISHELLSCYSCAPLEQTIRNITSAPCSVLNSLRGLSGFYLQLKAAAENIQKKTAAFCLPTAANRESSSHPPSPLMLTYTPLCLNPGATSIIHAASGAAPPRADMCHAH